MIGRYFSDYNAIINYNSTRKSGPSLDKYWVTQSGYFILAATVELVMQIADAKLLLCHEIPYKIRDNTV